LVIDLTSLWAGPLAGALLAATGATVIKVESKSRLDGARGNPHFYNLLNAKKSSLALDFSNLEELQHLKNLIAKADIILESTRPRALAQLGIHAESTAQNGASWVSITAHGREGEPANWIGFGDDAAIAAGLATAMERGWGKSLFAGDAIADPLTGITAALAAYASHQSGGARLISVPLSHVTAHACAIYEAVPTELQTWQKLAEADNAPLYAIRAEESK
jgi:crotonobetainyl-CoA:carnitine CoA-transferase CaiB-like acyl-CoA transferase